MAETTGHIPDHSTSGPVTRNPSGAVSMLILAVVPQLFDFLWSLGGLVLQSGGRNPAQVLADHLASFATGLRWLFGAAPALPEYLYAVIVRDSALATSVLSKVAPASPDILLALIYSYPLLAVALLTFLIRPRGPQDYYGGVVLMAVALFALWASSDLQGMHGFSFGAGTAPRMFGVLLLALGAAVALLGLLQEGAAMQTYAWRGPLFVMLAIVAFAVSIRPLGLVISGLASFLISALGTPETRWVETLIVGVCLTIGCAFLFPYVLGLPMPLFPRFLVQ
jgi:Tripartite tricarboxylate transporter TctB family